MYLQYTVQHISQIVISFSEQMVSDLISVNFPGDFHGDDFSVNLFIGQLGVMAS